MTASVLKKRSKTLERLKRTLKVGLHSQRTTCAAFECDPSRTSRNIYIRGYFVQHALRSTVWCYFLLFFFFCLLFTTVMSQWDFSNGKFRLPSPGKSSCNRVALPNLECVLGVFSVSIAHRTLTWTIGSLSCAQMLMHAIAHGVVRTPKESLH